MKILTALGARPQFIKAGILSHAITHSKTLSETIVHSGQHYDFNLSGIFFDQFNIHEPKYNLGVANGKHGFSTGSMLIEFEKVLELEKPDLLLVYGDTNTTLAASLAAAKLGIKIAHVEAGLRSFSRTMPEEINRVIVDRLSSLLFVPTEAARKNLQREGFNNSDIFLVGDVMYDLFLNNVDNFHDAKTTKNNLNIPDHPVLLVTVHRQENTDDGLILNKIVTSLESLTSEYFIVWPIHPRAKQKLNKDGFEFENSNIHFLDPLSYIDMQSLLSCSQILLTDSGGLQKEAFFHRVRCITLRQTTEWTELVELGWNTLCPPANIGELHGLIQKANSKKLEGVIPYGDGNACKKIVATLETMAW